MIKENVTTSFTEYRFVILLFSLLCEEQVHHIHSVDLMHKLFEYQQNPKYRFLFQNMNCKNQMIDLDKGIQTERFLFGPVTWNIYHPEKIRLHYHKEDIDFTYLKEELGEEGVQKMQEMVKDLSRCLLLEEQKVELELHRINPNHGYIMAMSPSQQKGWNLITDGDIFLEKDVSQEMPHVYFPSIVDKFTHEQLLNLKAYLYQVQNATFVTEQSFYKKDRKRVVISTLEEQEETLNNIIAKSYLPFEEKETPQARKIILNNV